MAASRKKSSFEKQQEKIQKEINKTMKKKDPYSGQPRLRAELEGNKAKEKEKKKKFRK